MKLTGTFQASDHSDRVQESVCRLLFSGLACRLLNPDQLTHCLNTGEVLDSCIVLTLFSTMIWLYHGGQSIKSAFLGLSVLASSFIKRPTASSMGQIGGTTEPEVAQCLTSNIT